MCQLMIEFGQWMQLDMKDMVWRYIEIWQYLTSFWGAAGATVVAPEPRSPRRTLWTGPTDHGGHGGHRHPERWRLCPGTSGAGHRRHSYRPKWVLKFRDFHFFVSKSIKCRYMITWTTWPDDPVDNRFRSSSHPSRHILVRVRVILTAQGPSRGPSGWLWVVFEDFGAIHDAPAKPAPTKGAWHKQTRIPWSNIAEWFVFLSVLA